MTTAVLFKLCATWLILSFILVSAGPVRRWWMEVAAASLVASLVSALLLFIWRVL